MFSNIQGPVKKTEVSAVLNVFICLLLTVCPAEGPAQLAGSVAAGAYAAPLYCRDVQLLGK